MKKNKKQRDLRAVTLKTGGIEMQENAVLFIIHQHLPAVVIVWVAKTKLN